MDPRTVCLIRQLLVPKREIDVGLSSHEDGEFRREAQPGTFRLIRLSTLSLFNSRVAHANVMAYRVQPHKAEYTANW